MASKHLFPWGNSYALFITKTLILELGVHNCRDVAHQTGFRSVNNSNYKKQNPKSGQTLNYITADQLVESHCTSHSSDCEANTKLRH